MILLRVIFVRRRRFDRACGRRSAVVAGDAFDALVQMRLESVVLDGAAIVFQGLGARGLAAGDGHGQVADFHALGRGEERHVHRIVVERIAEAAFVDDERAQAGALGFDGAGEAGGAGADADDVVRSAHGSSVRWEGCEFTFIARELGC